MSMQFVCGLVVFFFFYGYHHTGSVLQSTSRLANCLKFSMKNADAYRIHTQQARSGIRDTESNSGKLGEKTEKLNVKNTTSTM